MGAPEILTECRERGIILTANEDWLAFDAPVGALDPELRAELAAHKAEILATLTDWNTLPSRLPSAPFDQKAMAAIKAGHAVPVWSSVLQDWMWWVWDEKSRQKLLREGCQVPIYTLGELAVVSDQKVGPETIRGIHEMKKKSGRPLSPQRLKKNEQPK